MQKRKYAMLAVAILLLASISACCYWRSSHVPVFPDTDGRVVSITAYWSDCCSEYRKDLSTPDAVNAAMEQLRQLTYNPHKEYLYGPRPGVWVIRLVLQYESREEPKVVALAQGGPVTFNSKSDPCDFPDDDPNYFMTFPNEETLWDSFDAPEVLMWEYVEERTP